MKTGYGRSPGEVRGWPDVEWGDMPMLSGGGRDNPEASEQKGPVTPLAKVAQLGQPYSRLRLCAETVQAGWDPSQPHTPGQRCRLHTLVKETQEGPQKSESQDSQLENYLSSECSLLPTRRSISRGQKP